MENKLLFFTILFLLSFRAAAQCTDYKWPQDQAKAEKNVDAFKAAIKEQNYKAAIPGIQWMIAHAPQWHTDLYVAAIETYDNLAEKELEPGVKQNYLDSLFIIYDLRIKNCGDEGYVLNRKAYSARKYYNPNKAKAVESLAIFDKTFAVNGNNVLDNNLIGYIDAIWINDLPEDQVMQRYNKLMKVIDFKMNKAKSEKHNEEIARYNKVITYIDSKLPKMVKMDCEFVKKYIEQSYKTDPGNLRIAKNIFDVVTDEKCPYDPIWFEAAEALHAAASNFSVIKELAVAYISNKNFDKGASLLAEVQAKAGTAAEKAWIDLLKGDMEYQKGNKTLARDLYRQALVTDPTVKDAYERIGDLYSSATTDCSKVTSPAEEKLIYIAAFQMYLKSGNREKMVQTLAKYPTAEDLQKANWKSGESKKIPCWINETVTVRVRKN
jgi:tetratricopeptide (TPR) repeat protein